MTVPSRPFLISLFGIYVSSHKLSRRYPYLALVIFSPLQSTLNL
jgi:hypothetical protein